MDKKNKTNEFIEIACHIRKSNESVKKAKHEEANFIAIT